jgi:hypothetical protein
MFRYRAALLLLCLSLLPACAASNRAKEIPDTFLSDIDRSKKLATMPFDHAWVWTKAKKEAYHSVLIKPVRVDLLPPDAWKSSASSLITSELEYREKSKEIATYFHQQLTEKLQAYPDARLKISQTPGAGIATLEVVFTELEFSHPIVHAGAIAAPIPGAAQALATISDPHAAFALRISDSVSGKLLATVADRKFPPIRIFDFNKVTLSSSLREICSNWSKELASALNKGPSEDTARYGVIKLLPW